VIRMAVPVTIALAALAGCEAAAPAAPASGVEYLGVETRLMDGDLVNFHVRMRGSGDPQDAVAYARCAAAGYTLIRGYGFARHVRTLTDRRSGILSADAVYTISPSLPRGSRTIDAEVVVDACHHAGIPTV